MTSVLELLHGISMPCSLEHFNLSQKHEAVRGFASAGRGKRNSPVRKHLLTGRRVGAHSSMDGFHGRLSERNNHGTKKTIKYTAKKLGQSIQQPNISTLIQKQSSCNEVGLEMLWHFCKRELELIQSSQEPKQSSATAPALDVAHAEGRKLRTSYLGLATVERQLLNADTLTQESDNL